jgi:plasmid stabilization system protein ParE
VPDYQDEAVREILEAPYRIIYYLNGDYIEILSVMHYRRLLPRKRDLLRSREHQSPE